MSTSSFPYEIVEFLKNNRLAVLATVSPAHIPYAALVYYLFDDNRIVISTSHDSNKLNNITNNDKIALVIGPQEREATLQIIGTAQIVKSTIFKASLVEKLAQVANANPDLMHFPPLLALSAKSSMEFIEISIEWFKYSTFTSHENNIIEGNPGKWSTSSV